MIVCPHVGIQPTCFWSPAPAGGVIMPPRSVPLSPRGSGPPVSPLPRPMQSALYPSPRGASCCKAAMRTGTPCAPVPSPCVPGAPPVRATLSSPHQTPKGCTGKSHPHSCPHTPTPYPTAPLCLHSGRSFFFRRILSAVKSLQLARL